MGYSYEPELELNNEERARLAALVPTEEFKILQKIFKTEIDKFSERLLNADPVKTDEVLAIHMLARSAAQFYQGITNAINREIQIFRESSRKTEILPDDVGYALNFDELETDNII